MSRRNQLNIKDSVRAREEYIDKQLKDAGLWEEGLSFELKRQYVDMIKASENTAKEEETKRRGTCFVEEEIEQYSSIPHPITIERHSQPSQEDSEPVITYESMSTVSRRRVLSPSVHNKETVKRSCQNKVSSATHVEHSPFAFSNLPKTPESSKTFKKINSLLSNKSITIKYSISPEKEKIPENITVSESDDECEEETDPLALSEDIPEKIIDSNTKENEESLVSKQPFSDNCPNLHSSGEISFVEEDATPSGSNSTNIFSLNSSAIKKAITQSKSAQNSIRIPLGSTEIEEKLSSKIDDASQDIFDYSSSPECPKASVPPSNVKTNEVKIKSPEENQIVDILNENLKDDVPLTRKFNLNREKSNLAYFKSSYETETKCVKRIYSLITDWQLALAKYQRSLANPCKWGLPICVDRQVKIGLFKKNYLNQMIIRPAHQGPDLSDTSDATSDSEKLLTDDSDDDFEIFMKKKRKPLAKSTRNGNRRKGKLKPNLPSSKETKEQTVEMSNENDKKEQHAEPPCVPETNGSKTPVDEEENNSQSLLDDLPVTLEEPMKSEPSSKIPMKNLRKSFDLFSNGSHAEAPTNTESISSKLLESQSGLVSEVQSQNTSKEVSKPEENNLSSVMEDSEGEMSIRRSNIKRKASSTFSIPPSKKPAHSDVEQEDDIVMECEIKPSSVRLKELLSKNRSKESQSSVPEKLNPLDNSTKHDSKSVSILEAALTECKSNNRDIPDHQSRTTPATHPQPLLPDMGTGDSSGAAAPVREKLNFIECPICLSMFSIREIELHASECNGPIEKV